MNRSKALDLKEVRIHSMIFAEDTKLATQEHANCTIVTIKTSEVVEILEFRSERFRETIYSLNHGDSIQEG